MKTLLLVFGVTFMVSTSFSQTVNVESNNDRVIKLEGFNPKYLKQLDFASKMNELENRSSGNISLDKKDFWSQWEEESLPLIDMSDKNQKEYFEKLESYYNSLSAMVQDVFTVSDIWYIYSFNEKLYLELPTH